MYLIFRSPAGRAKLQLGNAQTEVAKSATLVTTNIDGKISYCATIQEA